MTPSIPSLLRVSQFDVNDEFEDAPAVDDLQAAAADDAAEGSGEVPLPEWADMAVEDITFDALSKNGHVHAVITGGRLTALEIDPSWRASATPRDVEVSIAEAVNAAIDQVYAGVNAQIQAARPVNDLAGIVRDAHQQFLQANDGREDGELNAALVQMIDLLDELPNRLAELPADQDHVVDTQIEHGSDDDEVNVHVHNGYVTALSTQPNWTRKVSDEEFTKLVAQTVDAALEEFRETQLEQIVSQGDGIGGLVSALFEAQAYVSSGFQMDLENQNFGRKEDVERLVQA